MTIKRRKFIKNVGLAVPMFIAPLESIFAIDKLGNTDENTKNVSFNHSFKNINDRIWIGKTFWSIPMEDWEIKNKRLEFSGFMKNARLHLLTHVLNKGEGNFSLKADLGLLENKENKGSVGFSVGIKDETDPDSVKASCYFGKGMTTGISIDGMLFIGDEKKQLPKAFDYQNFELILKASSKGNKNEFTLIATDKNGQSAEIKHFNNGQLEGLVALENNCHESNGSTFWCKSIHFEGNKAKHVPENSFGPILWAMHTLSKNTLKLNVQLPPVGSKDSQKVKLHLKKNGKWNKEEVKIIDPISFTAIFKITNWDGNIDVPYRLVYTIDKEQHRYEGTIRKDPTDKALRFGGLTCQHAMGFPYRPLVENLEKSNPDMLFFSGDQLYENNGGYPIKRQPEDRAILNYLGKWFMFGWAFGDVMRDRPTICTPDDHDVYQGNLWGEGGRAISFEKWKTVKDANGGFVQTPGMVNVVNETQCGHLPGIETRTKLPSGITTWYSHLIYGRISFAIVSDRAFKSGPQQIRDGEGRIDHIKNRLKPQELESDKLTFFGQQQLDFLKNWATDWEGSDMKVLLSQTLFSNVGTHHGIEKQFLFGDMDSGGWPKAQRDKVVKLMRKACAFHINGDQHLPFIVQYSVDEPRDAGWTFCTPAISTGYPRWGQPDDVNTPFTDRPAHNLPNTGCYRDIFGNNNYIYAVGNPEDNFNSEKNRYEKCQKKASGFGLVTFDQKQRTIKMEAIRFLANLDIDSEKNRYSGWPLTIDQFDNDGRRPLGYLPILKFSKTNQVLKIVNEQTKELISAIRVIGDTHKPKVYDFAVYSLIVGEGQEEKTIKGIEISSDPGAIINV